MNNDICFSNIHMNKDIYINGEVCMVKVVESKIEWWILKILEDKTTCVVHCLWNHAITARGEECITQKLTKMFAQTAIHGAVCECDSFQH